MDFIIPWLWYLAAFLIGSGVAWAILTVTIKETNAQQAEAALATKAEAR
ncbi:channel accessory protein ArfB [Mycolicibacterium brumae]|uniref:Uncharacterized protein n=1 Tax=Mycolicibacterium brumae TaxID=85968 RepID=A0A2G5PF37_9MYCO|nr:hypothetical protein [Mycolicibacterium brumae]MCV7191641.1 hypothetical protein [Mycolicibacterium brumae]PIB76939.1 hypothetical protein CQY22_004715 [Mycolicibacterium brumae]RWA20503.1 hypothetical protein MBRU_02270 [Mycolicibacterium brumae DSM 44177]UWW07603.1 hypothetical protein L2Z93_000624 [Mycolicibacterium brumae]